MDPGAAAGERAELVETFSPKVTAMLLGCLSVDEPEEVRTNASYALIHLPGSYESKQLADILMSDSSIYVRFNCCTALIAAGHASARAMLEDVLASADDPELVRLGQSNFSVLEADSENRVTEDPR
ncbi:MAG TPA: hypothetical protein VFA46_03605 [Actinomycetes bacterium]|nr:hypothetical protein [Actinomycetes bacterium]